MDYIGSKVKLNEWMFNIIKDIVSPNGSVFVDGCSGSGAVSRYAAELGYNVIANDLMQFPKVLANGSIGLTETHRQAVFDKIKKLNVLEGIEGFFYEHYTSPTTYFSAPNARRIDAVRLSLKKEKDEKVRDALLYCAIEALSRVSNTAGTHGAFMRELKDRAKAPYTLKPERFYSGEIQAYSSDILKLLGWVKGDILYIDPPYNSRQYGNNYHLYETFVRYDNPKLVGMTKLRDGWQEESGSKFCYKKKCAEFMKAVIDAAKVKHIFISYSSDGLLTKDEICATFNATVEQKDQRRYKADKDGNREYSDKPLFEYLFHIQK